MINTLNLKRMMRATLLVLLMSVVGLSKGYAQEGFSVDGLNYTINDDGVSVTVSGEYGMSYYPLVIPESVNYDGVDYEVTAISDFAFSWTGMGGELVIPNSIVTIGESAFEGCSDLTRLTLGNSVVEIGDFAFYGCDGFEGDLVIPNSVITIGQNAFATWNGFSGSLILGNSVVSIGDGAFDNCGFTGELVIPNTVTTIGEGAFYGCHGFTGSLVIPNTLNTINDWAFADCSGFTGELVIPNSVTAIGEYAFAWCNGFTGLVIPNTVTTIGEGAFVYCEGITGTLTIPKSVTEIKGNAFEGCGGFELIVVDPENVVYDSRNNCNGIIETATNTLIIGFPNTLIPNTVTSIGDDAFRSCGVASISIPNSVEKIGRGAFNFSSLTSVVIPSSVTTITGPLFCGCSDLEQIIIEEGNPIYDSRDNCNVIIESSTNVLISGCKNTVIPNTVSVIGNSAFASCNILSIAIPLSVKKIEQGAFCYSSLTGDLVIPNSVISIGDYAFYYCWNLNGTLVLGDGVSQIGERAFEDCDYLNNVISLASTPPILGSDAFGWELKDQLIVSCGDKDVYDASDWAGCFNTINEDCNSYAVSVENNTLGTISVSVDQAQLGQEVVVNCTPTSGYETIQILVSKSGNVEQTIPVFYEPDMGSFFVMPNYDVVVQAVFSGHSVGEDALVETLVYPNPAVGLVHVEAENLRHVSVFNAVGQKVYEEQVDGDELEINLGSQEVGVYLIRLETASGVTAKRVVLTK